MKATTKTQRIISVILTLLMAVSLLSVNAFALNENDTGTITVENAEQGVTVTAYRLMKANVNTNGQPAEPEYTWDSAVASWVRTNYPTYIGSDTDNSVKKPFSPDMIRQSQMPKLPHSTMRWQAQFVAERSL